MRLPAIGAIVGFALGLFFLGIVFSMPIDQEDVIVVEYTSQPLQYETSHAPDRQVSRWLIFGNATEVQYLVKNTDTVDGTFTLNFVFSNDKETKSVTKKLMILAGVQEAVKEKSPLGGVSSVKLNVIPSYKQVAQQRTISQDITLWDRIGDILPILRIFN